MRQFVFLALVPAAPAHAPPRLRLNAYQTLSGGDSEKGSCCTQLNTSPVDSA
ncbi:MAG: hypothetical protein V4610_06220 [Pseudomonadota bacterium]|jgi:hypothetical protein